MSDHQKLLIIEDDEEITRQLKWAFSDNYHVYFANDLHSALNTMKRRTFSVVTLDLGLPPNPNDSIIGMRLLKNILQIQPYAKIVVVTGNNDQENALQSITLGAWDYYLKPINIDELKVIIDRAFFVNELEKKNRQRQDKLTEKGQFEGLIGNSSEMNQLFNHIKKVSSANVPVLILGESGTGKELIARAIHNQSSRRGNPFVAINCGAIPENLLESELFGFEKGSFTGAHIQRKGKVEYANGGTLFLDEIGELPLSLQVKLLRFLQEKSIERIGGHKNIQLDVRFLSATQIDLIKAIGEGTFREDLYYRLGVVSIDVPPLKKRGSDILLLANFFKSKYSEEMGLPSAKFDQTALKALLNYQWPGNVRELENRIKRALLMCEGSIIRPQNLDISLTPSQNIKCDTLKEARKSMEKMFLFDALTINNWNISQTASHIGVTRPTLYDLIKKHHIEKLTVN